MYKWLANSKHPSYYAAKMLICQHLSIIFFAVFFYKSLQKAKILRNICNESLFYSLLFRAAAKAFDMSANIKSTLAGAFISFKADLNAADAAFDLNNILAVADSFVSFDDIAVQSELSDACGDLDPIIILRS